MSSPAQRYAESQERNRIGKTEFGKFTQSLTFDLDPFQIQACQELEAGKGVLVAAPTGAGKTIVGEFAVHLALAQRKKAFYTTPIKALSNQKYTELVQTYGATRVGLLTGDVSINPEADVVVMTTEVLRNMIYADSRTLEHLGYVVMDEVHYLADKFRGAVWEEVIIHLPESVQLVSLSATVSNAEEFGAWLDTVRGDTSIIVSEHRPVPLWQHVMVGNRILDLFVNDVSFDELDTVDGAEPQVNGALIDLAKDETRLNQASGWGQNRSRRGGHQRRRYTAPKTKHRVASRVEVIRALDQAGLLPAITFIFSRNGCDQAVAQCVSSDLWLTTEEERREIAQEMDDGVAHLPEADLEVLGYWGFREGLLRGFAAHHAGMLPTFKEIVERLFARGLVKAVFATETLALGVNMPARSVVLEKLDKFNGENHVQITPGEYTQLTGRAGRRGIDVEGHAVVLWQPGTDPAAVAGLASRRSYPLNSSFRPTYNMSINLISQFGVKRTRSILESSFAQFQVDRSVVGMAKEVRNREESLKGYEKAMECDRGDFAEYAAIRRALGDAEKGVAKSKNRNRRSAAAHSLTDLLPGDVLKVHGRKFGGHVVVLNPDSAAPQPRPTVLTEDKHLRRLGVQELDGPVEIVSAIRVPKRIAAKTPKERRDLASSMLAALREGRPPRHRTEARVQAGNQEREEQIAALRRQLREHPCHGCPDREAHARWSERWARLRKDTDVLISQIKGRTNTIVKTFDRVCQVLAENEYLERDADAGWVPTDRGQQLRRIYGERDLLTSMTLSAGAFDGLEAAQVAALASVLVYQARREEAGLPVKVPPGMEPSIDTVIRLWSKLTDQEEQARLPETAEPSFGLLWPMYKWARGRSLARVLEGTELAAGDFVRWAKQVIDVLDQLAKVPHIAPALRGTIDQAIDLVRRGVVASSVVEG